MPANTPTVEANDRTVSPAAPGCEVVSEIGAEHDRVAAGQGGDRSISCRYAIGPSGDAQGAGMQSVSEPPLTGLKPAARLRLRLRWCELGRLGVDGGRVRVGDGAERRLAELAAVELGDVRSRAEPARVQRLDERELDGRGQYQRSDERVDHLVERVDRDQRVNQPGLRVGVPGEHVGGGGAELGRIKPGAERERPVGGQAALQPVDRRRLQ